MLARKGIFTTPSISAKSQRLLRILWNKISNTLILPGVKMLARKGIFTTPSISVAVEDRKKPTAFGNFVSQNSQHTNYNIFFFPLQ